MNERIFEGNFLHWARDFNELVRAGSWAGAAKSLKTSRSSVKYSMRSLEEAVGAALLDPASEGVALTDAGCRFLEDSRRLLAELEEMTGALRGGSEVRGTVSIAAPVYLTQKYLPDVLRIHAERHPHADVLVYAGNMNECYARLRGRSTDVVFGVCMGFEPDMEETVLGAEPLVLALPSARRPAGGWTKEAVGALPFVIVENVHAGESMAHSVAQRLLEPLGLSPRVQVRANNGVSAWAAAKALRCAAVLGEHHVTAEDGYEFFDLGAVLPVRKLGLTVLKGAWRPAACAAFMETFREVFPSLAKASSLPLKPWDLQ